MKRPAAPSTGDEAVSRDRVKVWGNLPAGAGGSVELSAPIGWIVAVVGAGLVLSSFGLFFPPMGVPGATFLIGGTAILMGAVLFLQGRRAAGAGARLRGGEAPWRVDGFTSPVVRDRRGDEGRFYLVAGVGGAAIGLTTMAWFGEGNVRLMAILYVIVGSLTAAWGAFLIARAWKFRAARVALRSIPFRTGDAVEVAFRGDRRLANLGDVVVRLQCLEEVTTYQNNRHHTNVYRIYQEERRVATDATGSATLRFDVPADLPGTRLRTEEARDPAYRWRLLVRSDQPGLDLDADFPLPIYSHG